MDIRKSQSSMSTVDTTARQSEPKRTFAAGTVLTAKATDMLPELVQFKLKAFMTQYGIPFDLNDIKLDGKMADNVKAMRKIKEMVEGDSKLLPEMLKLIKGLMRAEIKLAQFHRGVTTAALKHQEKLDKYTADIFLKMAGYGAKATKLEHRTNVRNKLREKRTEAYANHYENTVYGEEAKIIDVEFEVLESNKKILTQSKTKRTEFNAERKKKINEYVESAFTD